MITPKITPKITPRITEPTQRTPAAQRSPYAQRCARFTPHRTHATPHRTGERGSVSVEFAMLLPVVFVVFAFAVVLIDIGVTKSQMTSSLAQMTRVCGVQPDDLQGCLQDALLNANLNASGLGQKCDNIEVNVVAETDDWFQSTMTCQYDGYRPERLLGFATDGDLTLIRQLWNLEVETVFAKYGVTN